MDSRLDMSLDDIIKNNKSSSSSRGGGNSGGARTRGARSGGVGGGPGPSRRFSNRAGHRSTPYPSAPAKAPDSFWQHDMYASQVGVGVLGVGGHGHGHGGGASSIETGTKLYISNLDYGVSNDDIKELFSEVGDLKRYGIHYDKSGRSKGTAEIVFSKKGDGLAALKRYNNVELDGKPMKIEIVGTNIPSGPPVFNGAFNGAFNGGFNGVARRPPGVYRSAQGRGGVMKRTRGGPGGGRGSARGRGRGRGRSDEKVSAEDLDADLEKYHTQANPSMETS